MVESKLLAARDMHRAVVTDPQFRVPRRPALCRGLVTVPLPDGILVEGAAGRQVLRGGATRELIPRLLPLLDGTREVSDIAAEAGVRPEHVEQVRALLYTCGLLEEGVPQAVGHEAADEAAGQDAAATPEPVLTYLSRNLDSTRVNASAAEAAQRLATARVAVTGDGALAAAVRAELAAVGIRAGAPPSDEPDGTPLDLVVAVEEPGSAAADPDGTASWCARHGVPLLPVSVTGSTLDVGPYVDDSFTVSYADARRQLAPVGAPGAAPAACADSERLMSAALVAAHVTALVARVGSTPVLRGRVRTDLGTWRQEVHLTAPVPAHTDGRSTLTADGVPLALAFETSVAFPPRRLLNPRDHQMHYKPGNIALQRESKRWPSARTFALPADGTAPLTPLRGGTSPAVSRVDLGHLASVLLRGAGLRQDPVPAKDVQRWAPTGGNLGSVQLHALVRGVDGLPDGVWGYEAAAHRLALLSEALPDAAPADDGAAAAPVTLVLTGALARVASKYSAFAWRVVHLDAGAALAQICHVAASLGLHALPLDRWDDLGLAAALDLDLDAEPVTGVLTLRPSAMKES